MKTNLLPITLTNGLSAVLSSINWEFIDASFSDVNVNAFAVTLSGKLKLSMWEAYELLTVADFNAIHAQALAFARNESERETIDRSELRRWLARQ